MLEVDIQMYFCLILGKQLVRNTMHHNFFLPEQFSGQPGTLGTSAALVKTLSFDLIQILHTSATIFNNDATAFYNRVLPSLSPYDV